MAMTWLIDRLRPFIGNENALGSVLYFLLFISSFYLVTRHCFNRHSRQAEYSDWPFVKFETVRLTGHKQIIEQVQLKERPQTIEELFSILDPKSTRILWINQHTFISINGWSITRFMDDPGMHRMLALDFTCSRKDGPWKRIHIYSRSSEQAAESISFLMELEHQFTTVDICCHLDNNGSDAPFDTTALTIDCIQRILTPSRDIEIGFEGFHLNAEQSAAVAYYSHSLNLGHNTTVYGDAFITALQKRKHRIRSLSLREQPFDDANWHHFLILLAEGGRRKVQALTLFHGCFVAPQDCPLLVKAHVESLTIHSSCLHDDAQSLVEAVATGMSPPCLHLFGYQADVFVRVLQSLQNDACSLKSLHISLLGPHHDPQLKRTLQVALTNNQSLESLTINNVMDVNEWVQAFTPLTFHRKLTKLSLNQVNTLSREASEEFVHILETNRNIELTYSFSDSTRKRHCDEWETTIEHTQRSNRFFRSAVPFAFDSKNSNREAIFAAAISHSRHDPRRLALLLSQNADLLANATPSSFDQTRQRAFWVCCTDRMIRIHQAAQPPLLTWFHKVHDCVKVLAEDLLYLFCGILIFPNDGWFSERKNESAT